ncbi:nuclear transport factor 2 family protein [Tsuneonella sp. HG249]
MAGRFVAAVNAHDADALRGLVTEDFTSIDSWREGIVGRETAIAGARMLFAADPGLRLEVETTSFSDPYVLMRGWVESANPEVGRRRAVWRARCEDGLIAEWQAWAEGRPPRLNRAFNPEATIDMSERAPEKPGTP